MAKKRKKGYPDLDPVWRTLLELYASVDDVMTEAGAFDPENIHKSLGRIYRSWLDSRETLDPDFDREKYRHDMKARQKSAQLTPLGRKLPARDRRKSSTVLTSISEKSQNRKERPESKPARTSARRARSDGRASGGRSRPEKSSGSGEVSHTAREAASGSGSKKRATQRSQKGKG